MSDRPRPGLDPRRLAVEGVVIVASILLAFLIDAAWQERAERQRERSVLVNLEAEFSEVVGVLESFTGSRALREAAAVSLLESGTNPDSELPPDIVTQLVLVFLNQRTLDVPSGALNSYLASGDPELIQNLRLRALLASWLSLLEENAEEEVSEGRFVQEELRPFLMSRMALGPVYAAHPGQIYGTFPGEAVDTIAIRGVLVDSAFLNLMTIRLAGLRVLRREIEALAASGAEVLTLLREELR